MTEPTYSINGGDQIHGINAAWDDTVVQPKDSGKVDYSDWKPHVWRANIMTVEFYDILRAALWTTLTSLETNDYNYRNEAQTYDTAILETLTGRHVGHRMTDVVAEFRVDQTSRTLGEFSTAFDSSFKI